MALGQLGARRLVAAVQFRNGNTANPLGDVSVDVNDAHNVIRLTACRGGRSPLETVGNVKGDQSNTRLTTFTHFGYFVIGRGFTNNPGGGNLGDNRHSHGCRLLGCFRFQQHVFVISGHDLNELQ